MKTTAAYLLFSVIVKIRNLNLHSRAFAKCFTHWSFIALTDVVAANAFVVVQREGPQLEVAVYVQIGRGTLMD